MLRVVITRTLQQNIAADLRGRLRWLFGLGWTTEVSGCALSCGPAQKFEFITWFRVSVEYHYSAQAVVEVRVAGEIVAGLLWAGLSSTDYVTGLSQTTAE